MICKCVYMAFSSCSKIKNFLHVHCRYVDGRWGWCRRSRFCCICYMQEPAPAIRCLCDTILPSLPLFLNASSAIALQRGRLPGVLSALQCLSVSQPVHHPLSVVNATEGEGFLQRTLYLSHSAPSFAIAHCQFTIQQELWQAVVFHPWDMSSQTQLYL